MLPAYKKMNVKRFVSSAIVGIMIVALGGCASNDPVSPETEETPLQIRVDVQPPVSYRTIDTWNYWNDPVTVYFELESAAEPGGDDHEDDDHAHSVGTKIPVVTLGKTANGDDDHSGEDSGGYTGSISVAGMEIQMEIAEATDLYEMSLGGEMHEHHASAGSHMVQVRVIDNATGHHAHGGITVSHSELTITAIAATDTVEIELKPVQGGHGYRYEANAALPAGTYDLHLEIESPGFMRTAETQNRWTEHFEAEFHEFTIDTSFTGGSIGETLLTGSNGDSLMVSLRAGDLKTYGAIGMGALPMTGNENINFSVRLEDPTIASPGQILYGAGVNVTVVQPASGATVAGTFNPVFGHHGFYFGKNMKVGIDGAGGGSAEDGH